MPLIIYWLSTKGILLQRNESPFRGKSSHLQIQTERLGAQRGFFYVILYPKSIFGHKETLYSSGPFFCFTFTAEPGAAFPGWWRQELVIAAHSDHFAGQHQGQGSRCAPHQACASPWGQPESVIPTLSLEHLSWTESISSDPKACLHVWSSVHLHRWGLVHHLWQREEDTVTILHAQKHALMLRQV